MLRIDGRTAIITGSGNGIGQAAAELLGRAGARVVAVDLEKGPVEELAGRVRAAGGIALPLVADVADASAVQQMVEFAVASFGSADILFANAAIQIIKPAADMSEPDWDRLLNVNLKGVFLCCRAVIPHMRQHGSGAIVISASGHAVGTYPGFSAYAASKAAAIAFMRGVALDYAADGIRANCVIPGATDTRMLQSYFNNSRDPEAARADLITQIPLRRLADPADVAKAVLFLVSDCASYITGTCLTVDGGLMAQG